MEANYLWLIPALPLFSSVIIRFFGKRLFGRRMVHALACGSVFVSFVLSVRAFLALRAGGEGEVLINALTPWIAVGKFEPWIRFVIDSLSSTMALVVTGVGFLIHVYSTGYMGHDKDYERFFAYMNLFMAMMLILVLADNLLLMFVGWEGVGLCSYLLIGFWFDVKANADAGKKAFIVNRIGDFGFLIGIMTLLWTMGLALDIWSVDFTVLRAHAALFTHHTIFGMSAVTFATLMLFVGATGKSAQIPLFVWLPDAMAGPTPVSALIHAATMVTAGVYMVARLSFLFDLAPFTLTVIATVGGLTALFSATIGLVQNDIKKVLAYSTVSQLGYMFLACGVGAYASDIFHLSTHAYFKALLFLGAGSVIHAMGGEQDIRKMGGLKSKIPVTYWTFFIATVAIAGFPPFAGFFSKDEILWQAWNRSWVFWGMGALGALLTSFYMFRLLFLTFYGECRASEEVKHHIHESPLSMTVPLMILAVLSVVGGWLWWPAFASVSEAFPEWLSSSVIVHHVEGSHTTEMLLASISVGIAAVGCFAAYRFYRVAPSIPVALAKRNEGIYRTLLNKYYVDELYAKTVVAGTRRFSDLCAWFDSVIVDGAVNGAGWLLRIVVFVDGTFDRWVVDGLVNLIGSRTIALGRRMRQIQTGQIQTYLGALAAGLAAVMIVWMSLKVGS
ncbi:MAG: NADH-quinone oxidoreductase subunit L [Pseudomonadota bacterium]